MNMFFGIGLTRNAFSLQTTLTFELTYNAPDGSVGMWQRGGFEPIKHEDLRGVLSEDEKNQLNIDRKSNGSSRRTSETIEADDDTSSIHSSPNKSAGLLGSRLSISSKTSGGKSPKR